MLFKPGVGIRLIKRAEVAKAYAQNQKTCIQQHHHAHEYGDKKSYDAFQTSARKNEHAELYPQYDYKHLIKFPVKLALYEGVKVSMNL